MTYCDGSCLVCVLLIVRSLEAVMEVTLVDAVAGEKASIPCNVPRPLEDDEASLILWYRLNLPNPIYTLDVRGVPIAEARHFPATDMKDRLRFDVGVHPPILVILPVEAGDEGDYKCRVDLRRSRTLILQSRLNIIVPPDEPIIMDEYGQRLRDLIGPYDEGSKLVLICDVDGGNPSPSVTWWRGNMLLDDDFNVTTKGFVRNVLTLNEIQRSDWMILYFCKASNTHLSKPKVAGIQMDLNLLPLNVTITGQYNPMLAGEKYTITCMTSGSRPAAITSWWFSESKINLGINEIAEENENSTVSVFEFIPVPEDNRRVLICKAANPAMSKSTVQAAIILNIHFAPLLNLTINGSSYGIDIKEGDDVYMECVITSNPWIQEVKWHFRQKLLTSNIASGIVINNQTLTLKRAREKHNGKYYCSADNSVDRGISNSLSVFVKFPPKCKSNDEIYVLTENETINVTCQVEADPNDVTFQWSLETSQGTVILQNWNSSNVLFYTPITENGYGTLSCWGRNSVDVQATPCQFKIVAASTPDAPHSCTLGNLTMQSFLLECAAGYNGSLSQTFHLEIYDSFTQMVIHNLTNATAPYFKVYGLSSGTSYMLLLYASNARGRSYSMTLVTTTLLPAERRTASEIKIYLHLIIRIFIGIVVGLCGLITVVCFILAIRKFRRKNNKALFTGFMIILHVLDTSERYLPNGAKTDSVRITIFENPDPDNAYRLKTLSQQLISTTFPAPANTNTISNASASPSVLPPEVTPNDFTKAVLALPILQNFLDVKIDTYEAGDIMNSIELAYFNALGHPSPPIVANNDAQIIAKLNVLTIPLLVHLKGNTVEKFLIFQKIAIVSSYVQSFAKSIDNSLKSSVLDSNNALIRAIHEGYINFIQLLGLSFSDRAYILSLIFHEEVIDLVKAYSPETSNQQLNSTTFPAPANSNTISIAPVSSNVLLPEFTPNVFTKAVLELPVLQNFLDVNINRFEAGDIIHHIEKAFLTALGHPTPDTVSNIDGTSNENSSIDNAVKKDLDEANDGSEKGPDIIPQSADSDVFFVSGKMIETSNSPKKSVIRDNYRKYKHTVL